MKNPEAWRRTGQRHKTLSVHLSNTYWLSCQDKFTHTCSDDAPREYNRFCHFLKFKDFKTKDVFPNEKITKKQAIALNALLANGFKHPGKPLKIALHNKNFQEGSRAALSGYGHAPFKAMLKMLERQGMVTVKSQRSSNPKFHQISTIAGTPKLVDAVKRISSPILIYRPDYVVLMKGKAKQSETIKITETTSDDMPDFGRERKRKPRRIYIPIKCRTNPRIKKIEDMMRRHHDMLERHVFTCQVPRSAVFRVRKSHAEEKKKFTRREMVKQLLLATINIECKGSIRDVRRNTINAAMGELISNGRDVPPDTPDSRFKYPVCVLSDNVHTGGRLYGSFWIGCKRELRPYTRIDGQQLIEFDFSAMHPAILYQMEGVIPPDEVYIYDKTNEELPLNYRILKDLLLEIEKFHKPIAHHFYQEAWRRCVTVESNLIRDIIDTAGHAGLPVISIHDAVACRVDDADQVRSIIKGKTALKFKEKPWL